MKNFIIFCFFFLLCFNIAEAQTNANIAGPENVLVVWNGNSSVSDSVQQYYVEKRNIPTSNVLRLDSLVSKNITVGGVTHPIIIAQETDIIRDSINHEIGTWYATPHAWKYFYEYLAAPIKDHISSNNLTDIRYIVLIKGIPFKIQAAADSGGVLCNVTVDGLLNLLNTNNYETLLDSIYLDYRSRAISGTNYNYRPIYALTNPYFAGTFGIDPNYTFNYRFAPGYFARNWKGFTVKLDYLVSHIDGISYEVVKGVIDRSVDPDMSGTAYWVLDDDPTLTFGHWMFSDTKTRLESFGFNVEYDTTNNWITSHSENVMGFTSWGTHAENGNCAWDDSAWVKDSLNFNLSNGAIFNTFESFNGHSLSTLQWRHIANTPQTGCNHTQGLATQWTEIGGTGFAAHAWEPFFSPMGVVDNRKTFNTYAMGYSMVDAIYQGLNYLSWVNVVVGDPLTTIAWGKQQLAENLTWEGTNLVTGEIDMTNHIITIEDSSVINLRHQGFITGDGKLIIGNNVTFNIYSWQKGLFLSYDSNNPRLVWGEHPTFGSSANYNIYRKIDTSAWSLIAQTTSLEYTDTEMLINIPGDLAPNLFYKILASSEMPGYDTSNTVQASAEKGKNKITANNEIAELSYSLDQNYPNPFNPETRINYVIKENGLVQLTVYNVLGQTVKELVNEMQSAGSHSVRFNAADLPSGVYIYNLKSGDYLSSKKMLLVK